MIRSHLAQANRYIAEMRADIARERVIIEHALDSGYPSAVAESMLHALEGALRIFEKHRELILDQLNRPSAYSTRILCPGHLCSGRVAGVPLPNPQPAPPDQTR